jgi:hypothetical protein
VLKPLKELAQEIGLSESDARRILIYAGLRSVGGQFEECSFLRMYIHYLHEEHFGFVAAQAMAGVKPEVQKKKPIRGHLSGRKRAAANTPWAFVPNCDSRKRVV